MMLFQIKLNLPSTWRKWQTWRTWQNVGPTITCLETQFVTLHEGTSTSFSDTPISQWIFLGNPLVSLDPKNHQKPHWFIGSLDPSPIHSSSGLRSKLPRSRLSAFASIWAPPSLQSGTSDTTTVVAKSPAPTKPPSHRLTSAGAGAMGLVN